MNEDQIQGNSGQTREDAQKELRKKRWKRRRSWAKARSSGITVLVMGGMLLLTALFLLVFPRSTVSALESRTLTPFPKFSIAGWFDGEFTSGVTSHYDDTVPYRDSFQSMSNNFKSMFGLHAGKSGETDVSKSPSDQETPAPAESAAQETPSDAASSANAASPADGTAPADAASPADGTTPADAEALPDYSDATGRVALTFDDGPSGANSEALLAMLAERDARATFFLCGYRIEECPAELCKKLAEPGHELAMHGYSHSSFKEMSAGGIQDELSKTKELIQKNAGVTPTLVRPPYGAMNDDSYEALKQAGYPVIIWDVDTEDWNSSDPDEIANRAFEEVKDGSIILMHDMHQSSVDAAAKIIDQLQSEGYVFLTVSELAQSMGVQLEPGVRYRSIDPPEDESAEE